MEGGRIAAFTTAMTGELFALLRTHGLLIGSDVAARIAHAGHDSVHVLADPVLGNLYSAPIEAQGRGVCLIDSHAAFIAGNLRIGEQIS